MDSLWICAKVFTALSHFNSSYHWRWIEGIQTGDVPCARAGHRMVYIPPTDDVTSPRLFLMGGVDSTQTPLDDAYIGTLTFALDDNETSNPWNYTMTVTCNWEEISADLRYTGVTGQSVIYDPWYGPDQHPRIVIYGGYTPRSSLTDSIVMYDLVEEEWLTIIPNGVTFPEGRSDHACALDPREHRMVVHGGRDEYGNVLDDLLFFNLTTDTWSVWTGTGSPYRYGHGAVYYWLTLFGGISDEQDVMDDTLEFKPSESFKEWTITPDGDYGLDDPATVLETPRIKTGDWVWIHSGDEDHYYRSKFTIPYYIGHITIEGVTHADCKPAIFWPYSTLGPNTPFSEFLTEDVSMSEAISDYFRFGTSSYVIRDGAGITIRNLRIGHYHQEPGDGIPEAVLDQLETAGSSNDLLLRDPGIVMNAPTQIEDCECEGNVDGITMICVSSIPGFQEASVTGSLFHDNYVGAVVLETSHEFAYNTLEENLLCGVMLEKGAHGRIHDNLFVDNGKEEDVADYNWRCGVLSSFDVTVNVPHIQSPLIHSNTFIEPQRTLSVCQYTSGAQYLNCPIFMNNIIYNPDQGYEKAIFFSNRNTCRFRSQNNLYYCNSAWLTQADRSLLSDYDQGNINPGFASAGTGNYKLSTGSPCINAGYYALEPGIISESEYSDYHFLDAGYHFSNDSTAMDPVTDVDSTGNQITWEAPETIPTGYVIVWEIGDGDPLGSIHLGSGATSYGVPSELCGIGLWFGISAFSSSGQFSAPVFIQM